MAENSTQATNADIEAFLASVTPDVRRDDAHTMIALMGRLSGEPAVMWGPSMIGFGRYRYRHDSGREGEMFRLGFAPRKAALVLYGLGPSLQDPDVQARLGKFTQGKGCLYIKSLADVNMALVEEMLTEALARHV